MEKPEMRMKNVIETGVCRVCGCTEDNPCRDSESGIPCMWVDLAHTLCSSADCIASVPLRELEVIYLTSRCGG